MDDTLREGEQTPGVEYTEESRVRIFEVLYDAGIRLFNVGSPSVEQNRAGIKRIVGLGIGDAEIVGHIGCTKGEVNSAVECGLDSIKMYLAPTTEHLSAKFGMRFEDIGSARQFAMEKVVESVEYARSRGMGTISYTAEDATTTINNRDDHVFVFGKDGILERALDAGASRIALPDTRGRAMPWEIADMVAYAKKRFSRQSPEIEAHFHNDLGMALSNAIHAIKSGADIVHTTVNSMGERVGITSLEQLDADLFYGLDYDTGIQHKKLPSVAKEVEQLSGFPVSRNAPVVGENAFTHKSGRHQQAVANNPMAYQTIGSEFSSRDPILDFSSMTSKYGIENLLKESGVGNYTEDQVAKIVKRVRRYSQQSRSCDVPTVVEIASDVLGQSVVMPRKYIDSVYSEGIFMIKAPTGRSESIDRERIIKDLNKMPAVYLVREVFGSQDVDYVAFVRYNRPEEAEEIKKVLGGIDRGIDARFLSAGNKYR